MPLILAIESSCDETAIAIIRDGSLLSNIVSSQADVHAKYGGVMPEIASRLHVENIGVVLKEALEKANVKIGEIDAFAVTRGPGLIGALHVGLQSAKTLAMLFKKPLIPVHHLVGHIYANEYIQPFHFPLLAVVVSGGNTELILMKEHMSFEVIGETRDDAIGECYDKVARVLGLPYPGGIPIDRLAKEGNHTYNLPIPLKGEHTYDLSFSGLKTNVINLVHNLEQKGEKVNVPDMCKSFQDIAIGTIVDRVKRAVQEFEISEVILGGGVSANSYLRSEMTREMEKMNVHINIPPMWCCTDNAAMIAKVAERLYDMRLFAPLDLGVDPNWKIEDYDKFTN
ncbi:MAG: tRNA (adenosine(37)-N6)-threonylcarbamoyltransferase complex transferase subunit TsaD [Bacilli bacterium]|jgi:N6-L-threonylcarbamoyladenine synthase|nr:tRNA (adenosine(37)-N6)-threonylcarbamoyltransferase complex transferase subunit TsaD [Bacilli bacterium]MDD3068903.1 tRNA (adenosine(37)-N6)-threonylcarbamoyltransferase complex transferase subunit TsaD [Bacilli bacterium]HKM10458.1 tRNA (adenosine(37)-N6)-threonylcarbamoyltransferase complex transferase subunit TsaD [Bacilli bacterium]